LITLLLIGHTEEHATGMPEFLHDYIVHPFVHAIEHSLYMLPVLLIVFLLIAIVERKAMSRVRAALSSKGFGVVGAALLGLFPQCGFSVAAANLYSEGMISAGALAAVFIAISDEAFPIIMADPASTKWFLPLLAVKFFWAIAAGFVVDLIFRLTKLDKIEKKPSDEPFLDEPCDCGCGCERPGIVWPAIKRTLSIFLFIVMTGYVLNLIVEIVGTDNLGTLLMNDTLLQPFIAALIGLIPNCAGSIVLSQLFVSGALGFGSLAAGLSAGAGIGLMVMFRVNKSAKQNFAMLGLVYLLSVLLGIIITLIL